MSSDYGELLEKTETSDEKVVHWKIPDFKSLRINTYSSAPPFKFLNAKWYLEVNPCDTDRRIALQLYTNEDGVPYNLLCTFGFEDAEGALVESRSFYNTIWYKKSKFIAQIFDRRELMQRASELMPSGILTITCNIRLLDPPRKLIELDMLSENLKDLFINKDCYDVTLYVKDKEIKAHKAVLALRSPVFAAMFKHETSEKLTGIINIPDFDPDLFQEFLKFLYSGKVEIKSVNIAIYLYEAADKYDVKRLKMFCVEYMLQNIKVENVCDVIDLAEDYNESDLLAVAKDYFIKNHSEAEDVFGKGNDSVAGNGYENRSRYAFSPIPTVIAVHCRKLRTALARCGSLVRMQILVSAALALFVFASQFGSTE